MSSEQAVYRILDVAANRAAEGLRTVEEFVRFALDDPQLVEQAKAMRHGLAAAVARLPRAKLLSARDTLGDVGTEISLASERSRPGIEAVVVAALARVQQSLRCIEEYGKTVVPEMAAEVERIRYQIYTFGRQVELSMHRRQSLADAKLYVLIDILEEPELWRQRIVELAAAGADLIQIRDKAVSDRLLWERCQMAVEAVRSANVPSCRLIINDRADIAAAVDADGVHVGQDELPVEAVRRIVGDDKLIGLSTHSIEQAREAVRVGADYIGCGPTFPSRTKTFEQFPGVEFLRQVAREIELPAFAIGGIDLERLPEVIASGVGRIAVSGAVWNQADVVGAVRGLRRLLDAVTSSEAES
ncbi:thiamine phosphate synthase [Candidatus Laterigemmans baculatus]|uniref:thiamine phosphate synthase n=1 Tax=Candidatus Laterigemmans baculatus TaxID=2770505 RepID=UPI0013DBEF9F|nr:thiamine phosphate synthase [Candidatus Laterigemmans baculatus]